MSVEYFELRKSYDHSEAIIRLLSDRVAKKIQLVEEREALEELKSFVKVLELVIRGEQDIEELEPADAFDIFEQIILAVDLFDAEVGFNPIKVFYLSNGALALLALSQTTSKFGNCSKLTRRWQPRPPR